VSTANASEPDWVSDVLEFWFEEVGEQGWFTKSDRIDAAIRECFGGLQARLAMDGGIDAAIDDADPRQVLAAVIVFDQFSRNIHQGSPQAFAADVITRHLARQSVERGLDHSMPAVERLFLYLPFEHSENAEDQALSVSLIGKLGNEHWTRYALAHESIIKRFGRFPHRNAILGRTSAPEELALLDEPMGSF
jgi:uncharacterized protein (DUF924 family)